MQISSNEHQLQPWPAPQASSYVHKNHVQGIENSAEKKKKKKKSERVPAHSERTQVFELSMA